MDLFFLLIIFIFVIGPIIEKAMKGGAAQRPQQGKPLPPQRPPPRRVQQRFPEIPTPEPVEEGESGEDATEILPADLWEVLTGQRPSRTQGTRTRPVPKPTPASASSAPVRPAPQRQGRLARPTTRETSRAASSAPPPAPLRDDLAEADALIRRRDREEAQRRTLHRGRPEIVSLETPIQPESVRHKAFHRKLEHEAAPAIVDKPAGARLRMDRLAKSELQRAVLLHEILGSPKGLDE
ncbi:MAG: hypothetical protein PVH00_10425 [Gemmatimonadota bacterium]